MCAVGVFSAHEMCFFVHILPILRSVCPSNAKNNVL